MSWICNTAFLSLEWDPVPSTTSPQANIGKTKWHTKKKELREKRETAIMALKVTAKVLRGREPTTAKQELHYFTLFPVQEQYFH
jgi:hypothetical protein